MTSRLRKWIFRLIAIALGPLIFFGLSELILIILGTGYPTEFLISDTNDETKWRDNMHFGWRFFPPELARSSVPITLPKEKPPDTHRIVLLGGSAAMGDPDPVFGPTRILDVMLEARYPEKNFDVINSAMTAINSHVVREIADDLAKVKADTWIIYMGNNEVYGPFGAGTVFSAQASPLWITRTALLFKESKAGQLAQRFLAGGGDKKSWRGMEMFLEQQVTRDDPSLERVYQNFSANLRAIINSGRDAGAHVVVSSVAVNLKDCPPLASMEGKAEKLFHEGKYSEARDEDTLRFRADSRLNQLAKEVAGDENATFVDAAKGFSRDGAPGGELFVDHVHFTFEGSYLLARLLADEVAKGLGLQEPATPWLDEAACAQRLGLTPTHRVNILRFMRERLGSPPFKTQTNFQERDSRMATAITELDAQRTQEVAREAIRNYERLLKDQPDEWELRKEYSILLESIGKTAKASAQLERMVNQLPHRPEMWYQLGDLRKREGEWRKAQVAFERAIALTPDFHQAHQGLGICLSHQKAHQKADHHFSRAVEIEPDYIVAWIEWGTILTNRGDTAGAFQKYQSALAAAPDSLTANLHMARLYMKQGNAEDAEYHFREIVRIAPEAAISHVNLAAVLLRQQEHEEAVTHLKRALAIDPDNPVAQRYLAELHK